MGESLLKTINFGVSEESGNTYYVFPKGIKDPKQILIDLGVNIEATHNETMYDCTGKWYHSAVYFKARGKYVIGCQNYRLDV